MLIWAVDLDDLNGTSINFLAEAMGLQPSVVNGLADNSVINGDLGSVVEDDSTSEVTLLKGRQSRKYSNEWRA